MALHSEFICMHISGIVCMSADEESHLCLSAGVGGFGKEGGGVSGGG